MAEIEPIIAERSPRSDHKNILVVEDEDLLRQVLRRYLGLLGYRARSASTAAEALGLAAESLPDAALIDCHLPDGTGLELFRRLTDRHGQLPAILMSAYDLSRAEAREALETGVTGFIRKPFGYPELRRTLKILFRKGKGRMGLRKPGFYTKTGGVNTSPRYLSRTVFRKIFRNGLDMGGHVHFHVRGHEDHLILLCGRHAMGKVIVKSPKCGKGECIRWDRSSFADCNPESAIRDFSDAIELVRVDAADYEMSWPTLADFLCWLELTY
ncbi:MAG TPA: response regulator [bacterium]|nr:response regulator [bacterium]